MIISKKLNAETQISKLEISKMKMKRKMDINWVYAISSTGKCRMFKNYLAIAFVWRNNQILKITKKYNNILQLIINY